MCEENEVDKPHTYAEADYVLQKAKIFTFEVNDFLIVTEIKYLSLLMNLRYTTLNIIITEE